MSLIISPFTLNIFEILFLTFASFIRSFDKMSARWQVYCTGVWGGYSLNQTMILAFVRSVGASSSVEEFACCNSQELRL